MGVKKGGIGTGQTEVPILTTSESVIDGWKVTGIHLRISHRGKPLAYHNESVMDGKSPSIMSFAGLTTAVLYPNWTPPKQATHTSSHSLAEAEEGTAALPDGPCEGRYKILTLATGDGVAVSRQSLYDGWPYPMSHGTVV